MLGKVLGLPNQPKTNPFTRRQPRPLTVEDELRQRIKGLEFTVYVLGIYPHYLVDQLNKYLDEWEIRVNEEVEKRCQAQVDNDNVVIEQVEANFNLVYQENEELRGRVEELEREVERLQRKPVKVKVKRKKNHTPWDELEGEE